MLTIRELGGKEIHFHVQCDVKQRITPKNDFAKQEKSGEWNEVRRFGDCL